MIHLTFDVGDIMFLTVTKKILTDLSEGKMYRLKVDDFIFDSKESSQVIDEEISSQAWF